MKLLDMCQVQPAFRALSRGLTKSEIVGVDALGGRLLDLYLGDTAVSAASISARRTSSGSVGHGRETALTLEAVSIFETIVGTGVDRHIATRTCASSYLTDPNHVYILQAG